MPVRSALQREIKQRRPFRSRRQEAIVGLLRTTDVVRRALSRVVEPHGITLQQYNVLRILRGAGPAGLPTLEIAGRMVERAPGVTRLLDRLEAKRLALRARCSDDRRQVLCSISAAGLELLGRLDRAITAADQTCLGMLQASELSRLIRILDRIRSGAPRLPVTQGG